MVGDKMDNIYLDSKCEEIEEYTEFLSETIDDFREFYKPKKEKEAVYIQAIIQKFSNIFRRNWNGGKGG